MIISPLNFFLPFDAMLEDEGSYDDFESENDILSRYEKIVSYLNSLSGYDKARLLNSVVHRNNLGKAIGFTELDTPPQFNRAFIALVIHLEHACIDVTQCILSLAKEVLDQS